uniref:Uncharacterized protein n=1 Tax=Panagrellus redivivus TaxID=6233 RepID=A0A7E4VWE6_PANRE
MEAKSTTSAAPKMAHSITQGTRREEGGGTQIRPCMAGGWLAFEVHLSLGGKWLNCAIERENDLLTTFPQAIGKLPTQKHSLSHSTDSQLYQDLFMDSVMSRILDWIAFRCPIHCLPEMIALP